jgi:hypothetical protein
MKSKQFVQKITSIIRYRHAGSPRLKKDHQRKSENPPLKTPTPMLQVEFHKDEMDVISDIVRSLSGETTISHLLEVLTDRGFERNIALDKIQQLVNAHKVIIDNEERICWVYNPILAAHYRSRPELRIR